MATESLPPLSPPEPPVTARPFPGTRPEGERAKVVHALVRGMRVARVVEEVGRDVCWFAAGAAAMSGSVRGRMGIWLWLAMGLWVLSVAAGRKRSRTASLLVRLRGDDVVARESLRARGALSELGDALAGLGAWAEETRDALRAGKDAVEGVLGAFGAEEDATQLDVSKPLPPNPLPRDVATTMRPARVPSPPPSHPALSRDPDHDPKTCPVCIGGASEPPGSVAR